MIILEENAIESDVVKSEIRQLPTISRPDFLLGTANVYLSASPCRLEKGAVTVSLSNAPKNWF